MYGPGKYVKMQAARRNSDFCGPDKYGVYSKGSTVTNRFGKWFFTSEHGYVQIEDYTLLENVPQQPSKKTNLLIETSSKVNTTIDNVINVTTGFVVGVQKLGNSVAKEYPTISKIPVLSTVGKLTGVISMGNNFNKFIDDPSKNWWNGVEAFGQLGFMVFGGAEANLIYNLSVMTIDLTIDGVNYFNKNK